MSVYIPGMEMPNVPGRVEAVIQIHTDGSAIIAISPAEDQIGYWHEYPLVPVPDHGRLIDADALGTPGTIEENTLWRGRIETEVYLASTIYNAATIIPADKEVEG